jgi:site-specific DNA-methyltransferase (adenine-specific)
MKIINGIYENMDCMELMARYPDKHFDLAIVDPPYGIHSKLSRGEKGQHNFHKLYREASWKDESPSKEYFKELYRVSKNQIIFGANYYPENLIKSSGWIFWDKDRGGNLSFSDGEIIYTSFDYPTRKIKIVWDGFRKCEITNKIHPTQKPVKLYEWLLINYAKPNDLILDTHVGSASSLIACENLGYKYVASELDPDYYKQSMARLQKHLAQPNLLTNIVSKPIQMDLL